MKKEFNLNPEYSASFTGKVYFKDELISSESERVEIAIKGFRYNFDKAWFCLVCHYELDFSLENLRTVEFRSCKSRVVKLTCEHLPVFTKVMLYKPKFYIIPGFSRFAINRRGIVVSVRTNKVIEHRVGPYGYPVVAIYDPDKNGWRDISVHILLARTFLPNDSPEEKPFVNHKDGNKRNLALGNLEWASSEENNTHAVLNGLRADNRPCQIRDIVTGEITQHASIGSALRSIGYLKVNFNPYVEVNGVKRPKLLQKRYELKRDVQEPWFYEVGAKPMRVRLKPPFQIFNLRTGLIEERNSIKEISILTGATFDQVRRMLSNYTLRSIKGYTFRMKSEELWPLEIEEVSSNAAKRFQLTCRQNGEIRIFESKRAAVEFLGVDKKTFSSYLCNQKLLKDWEIKQL